MSRVVVCKGKDILKRTLIALEEVSPKLPNKGSKVLIKPNLVEARSVDSGAVTRPQVVEAIVQFLGDKDYEISVGEGAAVLDTSRCFEKANYLHLEGKYDIRCVDLHQDQFVEVKSQGSYWDRFQIAEIVKEADYVISAAVLKQHPFEVTLALKNMIGVLKPEPEYPTKSYIHREHDHDIWANRLVDVVSEVWPDLAVIDATTGMFGSHLSGRLKEFDLTLVSEDALACDIIGAELLEYEKVLHLELALDRRLGTRPTQVERISV